MILSLAICFYFQLKIQLINGIFLSLNPAADSFAKKYIIPIAAMPIKSNTINIFGLLNNKKRRITAAEIEAAGLA